MAEMSNFAEPMGRRGPEADFERQVRRSKKKKKTKMGSGDFVLTVLVLALTIFGIIMIFSASYYTSINKGFSPYHYFIRQSIYAFGGGLICFTLAVMDYHKLIRYTVPIYVVIVGMISLTYTGVGATYNSADRWIKLGPVTILPGELAKMACIFLCAWWVSERKHQNLDLRQSLLPLLGLEAIPIALVYLQPSTTTAATILIIVIGMLFVAGLRMVYLMMAGVAGVGVVVVHMLKSGGGYRASRLISFLDPFADEQGAGYQVVQGIYALASGGLRGLGLGKSVQKTLYLPDPQNDFILAIIGEELGFIGILILLAVYILLIWRCIIIALKAPDLLGKLIASGITIMIAMQVLMNVMVVTSLMPPTGITLPFVSYGGTAILLFLSAIGIMLNISRQGIRINIKQEEKENGSPE